MKSRLLIIGVLFSFLSFAQETSFKSYSVREGLAQSQVYSIVQDELGFLWMATQGGGVCRFDGEEFINYTIKDKLLSNTVNDLFVKGDSILLATDQGLSIFSAKGLKILRNIPSNVPLRKIGTYDSQIYFSSDTKIFELRKDSLKNLFDGSNENNVLLENFIILNDQLFMVSSMGIFDMKNRQNLSLGKIAIKHFTCFLNFDGYSVFGTYGGGVLVFQNEKGELIQKRDTLEIFKGLIITDLYKDTGGNIWVGSQRKGVFRYDSQDKKWENFGENEGLSNDHVKNIFEDDWNQVWIGTSGGGVNQYAGSQFLHYTENSGLNGNYIYSVLKSTKGELWVATSGNGVMRINDTLQQVYNSKNGFQDVKVKSIWEDQKGLIWFGTEGKGLSIYYSREGQKIAKGQFVQSLDTIINFDDGKRFPSTLWVKCFAEASNGDVYISTLGNGLVRARVKLDTFPIISFTNIRVKGEEKLSERINDMFFDSKDRLVMGTPNKGIGVLEKGLLKYYNKENSNVPNKITSVEQGFEDEIWFGSDQGLGYFNNDSVWLFDMSSGLASNNTYQIQKGEDNYIWVGSEKGVDRIRLVSRKQIEVKHFGSEEGFTGIETSSNASFKDLENNLWFGTVNGLSVYRPMKIEKTDFPPRIYFESVKLFYDALDLVPIDLEYHENSMSFSFDAVFLPNPKKVLYQWRLEGFDSEWSEPSRSKSITYSNLRPGKYVFYVRAGIDGSWSEAIKFEFSIQKPYWDEFWFRILIWGAGLVLMTLIVLFFVHRSKRRGKELRKQLELEKSLIELEQKALRLQMNPHFIFNSLNTIQHLIIEKDEKQAKYYLSKFAKLMRQILENSREKLISIDDEVRTLENYLIIEKFSRSDFDYDIHVDDSINTEEDILPPMMIQPFVENAIIHGLKGVEGRKGKITISFFDKIDFLQFEVEDNGQGREKAEEQKSQIANYHRSTALKVTQERLDNLNKGEDFKSFDIIDLKDDSGNPMGTKVILRVKF